MLVQVGRLEAAGINKLGARLQIGGQDKPRARLQNRRAGQARDKPGTSETADRQTGQAANRQDSRDRRLVETVCRQ